MIKKIFFQPRESKRNFIYDFVATLKDDFKKQKFLIKGSGVSINKNIAQKRACYEVIERYFTVNTEKDLQLFSLAIDDIINKKEHYLDPNDIIKEGSVMNPKDKVNKIAYSQKIDWVKGAYLANKRLVWIPAFMVIPNYRDFNGNRFFRVMSCGVSIGNTRPKAIINGIMELIERDAALLSWFGDKKPLLIDTSDTKNKNIKKIINNIKADGKDIRVFLTTTNIKIPSTFAVIFNHSRPNHNVAFGLAAEPELEKAILKSIEEALMITNTAESINFDKKKKKQNIKNLIDHILFCFYTKIAWQFVSKLIQQKPLSIEKINNKIKFIKNYSVDNLAPYLKSKNIELILLEFKNEFLKKNNLYMARIIARGLCPMFVGKKLPRTIEDIIRKRLAVSKLIKLNNNPHPFG